jgi:general nucleoside transport system ATP-binding protein
VGIHCGANWPVSPDGTHQERSVGGLPPALVMRGITKRFGAVTALDEADLVVQAGTVHALLGENGAGKTTLMRIAFGLIKPDAGSVAIAGIARRLTSVADAIAAGVGMVHQHYTLVPAMTVADNVALGLGGHYDVRAVSERIRSIGTETGLALDPAAGVSDLSVEAQQRLEIIKALARNARLLILDEPTAVLAPASAAELLRWLRTFAVGERAVVLITHKLREAVSVADDVTVLRRGRTVLAIAASGATEAALAHAMLGTSTRATDRSRTEPGAGAPSSVRASGPTTAFSTGLPTAPPAVVISAKDVTIRDLRGVMKLSGVSFEICAGEIVGVAGVEGQGQHELLRAVAGRMAVASGSLVAPPEVGFVPEDRQRDALVLEFPLYENVALRGAGSRRGRMKWRRVRDETRQLLAAFDVRADGEDVPASTLSGGNQQKLVLGRELAAKPSALVVENPSRGLDIQATAAVHDRLLDARDSGCAVLFYASDVDEVLALADRILVVAQGTVREVARDREIAGRAMLGLGG